MSGPNLAGGVFPSGGSRQTLAQVAYSGAYADLIGKPTLGSAAAQDVSAFATAAQGGLAATALQPGAQIPWGDVTGKPSIGTVTSVGMSVPTGLTVAGSPITGSGTLAISYSSGYQGYTGAEAGKLAGIATGATANQTDAYLLNRANHTGSQLAATISDFSTAADARISAAVGSSVQAYSAKLGALAGQTWAADQITYQTGASAVATTALTAFGRSLIDDADAATARNTLGLVIGTNVQAYSTLLGQIAALNLSGQDGKVLGVSSGVLALIAAGGGSVIKSSQSGYLNTSSISTTGSAGTEDYRYVDVTISAVDVTKAIVTFEGSMGSQGGANATGGYAQYGNNTITSIPTARLTSSTNLRISVSDKNNGLSLNSSTSINGRWKVVEFD